MLEEKIISVIEKYNMFSSGGSVTVGLSGGADSVCLTHFLKMNEDRFNIIVSAVHINHMLRGEQAQRDEDFCKGFCEKLGVPLKVFRKDIKALAERQNIGTEECGRNVRYECFGVQGTDYIATAHTLSDNLESVLMNLMRGTGLNGICGIPPVRDNIVRPLIECTREEIEKYNRDNSLVFVEDYSNSTDEYTRNKVRHNVVPELLRINSSLYSNLTKFLDNVNEDRVYLESVSLAALEDCRVKGGFDAGKISALPDALKHRVIALAVKEQAGVTPSRFHILSICSILAGGKVQINGANTVRVRNSVLDFPKHTPDLQWKVDLQIGKNYFPFGEIDLEIKSFDGRIASEKSVLRLDADKFKFRLTARSREPSDSYRLGDRGVTKSLKKLFNELGILPENRCKIPVFTAGERVLGIAGLVPVKEFKISPSTKSVLEVRVKYNDEG